MSTTLPALPRGRVFELTRRKIKPVHLMNFARYLSVFLSAGLPILGALTIIMDDTKDKPVKKAISQIAESLRVGNNITAAIGATRGAFPESFISLVRAAEATGQLDVVLGQVAKYIEREIEARKQIRSALTYPALVVAFAAVSVTVLVAFVLPRFQKFFLSFHAKLPLPTRMLIGFTNFLTGSKILLLEAGLVLILVGIFLQLRGPGRVVRDHLLLRLPLVGKVVQFSVVEKFCRILSSMVASGVQLPDAVALAAAGTSNRVYEPRLMAARQTMIDGGGIYAPLASTGLFPPAAIQMMRVGEETGTLDERLNEVSIFYSKELGYKLKALTDMLEPTAVVIVGLLVGFVAVALVSAIYGVYNQAHF